MKTDTMKLLHRSKYHKIWKRTEQVLQINQHLPKIL